MSQVRVRGARRPHFGWAAITTAEHEIVALVTRGLTNREVAARLHRSTRTVECHLAHVYDKLEVRSRTELMVAAVDAGRWPVAPGLAPPGA
jgi:DNA-binding NarL/FixJ family response regulator